MKRRMHPMLIVLIVLIGIGILSSMSSNLFSMAAAIIVFGGVFLLYKYPPTHWRKQEQRRPAPPTRNARAREKRRDVPFRVIQGNKRDNDDDPEKPYKYH